MRALAEFILRGRIQACSVALLGVFLPLISSATVGLVSLRKGPKEGFLVFLWLALPLILIHKVGADNPLLSATSIASLGIVVVAAAVHRALASWQWSILATLLAAVLCTLGFDILMSADVKALMETVRGVLTEIIKQQEGAQFKFVITGPLVLGFIAMALSVSSILSLMVSRWWQAGLYNPGGFQEEFHGFAIDLKVAVLLIAVILAGGFLPKGYEFWVELAALPLLFAGIALIHFAVKLFRLGGQWLALFYVGLLLFGALISVVLVGLGVADSLLDLRSKLTGFKNRKL